MKLLSALCLAKFCMYGGCFDDLNAWKPYPVARSHFIVHLLDSTIESSVTVFLVHVVVTSSALISQPNSIVLDLGWFSLKNLQNISD